MVFGFGGYIAWHLAYEEFLKPSTLLDEYVQHYVIVVSESILQFVGYEMNASGIVNADGCGIPPFFLLGWGAPALVQTAAKCMASIKCVATHNLLITFGPVRPVWLQPAQPPPAIQPANQQPASQASQAANHPTRQPAARQPTFTFRRLLIIIATSMRPQYYE